jgi:hypothetical protein
VFNRPSVPSVSAAGGRDFRPCSEGVHNVVSSPDAPDEWILGTAAKRLRTEVEFRKTMTGKIS